MNTESIFHCNDVNYAYNNFISEYTKKFETCFPYTTSSNKMNIDKTAWYDTELKSVYRTKQLLYKKFLRKPTETNKKLYSQVRNSYDRLTKKKKQS